MTTKIADNRALGILIRQNIRLARRSATGQLGPAAINQLRDLTETYRFSLGQGDFLLPRWRVVYHTLGTLAPIPTQSVCRHPCRAGASVL